MFHLSKPRLSASGHPGLFLGFMNILALDFRASRQNRGFRHSRAWQMPAECLCRILSKPCSLMLAKVQELIDALRIFSPSIHFIAYLTIYRRKKWISNAKVADFIELPVFNCSLSCSLSSSFFAEWNFADTTRAGSLLDIVIGKWDNKKR